MIENLKTRLGQNYYKLINFYSILILFSFILTLLACMPAFLFIDFNELINSDWQIISNYKYLLLFSIPYFLLFFISLYGLFKSFKNKIFLRYTSNNHIDNFYKDEFIEIYVFKIFFIFSFINILFFICLSIIDEKINKQFEQIILYTLIFLFIIDFSAIYRIFKTVYISLDDLHIKYYTQSSFEGSAILKNIQPDQFNFVIAYGIKGLFTNKILFDSTYEGSYIYYNRKKFDYSIVYKYMNDFNKDLDTLNSDDFLLIDIFKY